MNTCGKVVNLNYTFYSCCNNMFSGMLDAIPCHESNVCGYKHYQYKDTRACGNRRNASLTIRFVFIVTIYIVLDI